MKNQLYSKTFTKNILRFLVCLVVVLSFSASTKAQLTGTKNIPGDYADLAAAVVDLNTQGVGAGGVTLNVVAGNPQTPPSGGYVIGNTGSLVLTSTSASNPVIINGNGNTVTASAAIVAGNLNDALFKLIGADFITIQNFSMSENAGNSISSPVASNNMTEWGVALLYVSATDGAQNNTIQNNSIALKKTYTNTWGIYSNTRHTAAVVNVIAEITAASGANNSNKVYGNTISNVNQGIAFIGSLTAAFQDAGNDIGGGSLATGNTLTNWGGFVAVTAYISNPIASYGILNVNQIGDNTSFNTLTSAAVGGTSVTFRGILKDYNTAPVGTFISNINGNTVSMSSGFTSGTFECIRSQGMTALSTATINMNDNSIIGCSVTGASSSTIVGIINSSAPGVLNMNNNIIRSNTSSATSGGGLTGISNAGAVVTTINMNGNQIGNATGGAISFSAAISGTLTGISNSAGASGSSVSIQNNDFRGIVYGTAATAANTYISNTTGSPTSFNFSNNTFTNLNLNTTGGITFFAHASTLTATTVTNINNNSIVTAFVKSGAGGTILIRNSNASTPAGAVSNFQNNNFSNISFTGATTFSGYTDTDGGAPTKSITGNTFNNINGGTSAVSCITISFSGNNTTVSNNTITNITSQGAITGISQGGSGSSTVQTNSNNIVNNLVSNGAGGTVIGITCGSGATTTTVSNNTVSNLSTTGVSSTVTGLIISAGVTVNVSGNNISSISGSGTTSPVANGLTVSGGTTVNVFKNTICGISQSAAITTTSPCINGLLISAGTNINAFNNRISNLTSPAAGLADAIRGISVTSTSASNITNLVYNTVSLSGTSSAGNWGSSGIFANSVPTVTLRNNIVANNNIPKGSGLTVAYRRATTTLTTFGNTSNNNLLYAGVPGATKLIYNDGTNSDQTLAAYQIRVTPRENISVSENPSFLSTVCGNVAFLKLNTITPSMADNGAANIGGIADDFEGDIRQGNPGYLGTGVAPDIGADEFNGISSNPFVCQGTPSSGTASGWSPLAVTGFNADVIANGVGPANTTTTAAADVDASANYFLDATYQFDEASSLPSYSLPANGIIRSVGFPGLNYQVQSAVFNNSLRLATTGVPAVLNVTAPQSAGAIALLATAGNGPAVVTIAVNFTDASSQQFTSVSIPDWFNGTPFAVQGVNRVNASGAFTGTGVTTGTNPRLYDIILNLSPANSSKQIANITVTRTSASGVAHIFAVSLPSSTPVTVCSNSGSTITAIGATAGIGVTYQWKQSSTPGGPYVNVTGGTGATTTSYTTPALTSTTYYVMESSCVVSGLSSLSNEITLQVNTLSLNVTPASSILCLPGSGIPLTASGALLYSWAPSTGLNTAQGPSVIALPSASTVYTVTGTNSIGCQATATASITVGSKPTVSATAVPADVCTGGNSQLTAISPNQFPPNTYAFAGSSGTYTPIVGTAVAFSGVDDASTANLPIGFNFGYNGTVHTVFGVSSNGWIRPGQVTNSTGEFSNSLSSVANTIAALWDDHNVTDATVEYVTTGIAPNRVLIVQWTNLHINSGGSASSPLFNFQAKLYETGSVIQFVYGTTPAPLTMTASIGISGASGNFLSATPLLPSNTSTFSTTVENIGIANTDNLPSGTTFTLTPPQLSILWTPSTFIAGQETSLTPLATGVNTTITYTATVTGMLNCAGSATVKVNSGPLAVNISGPSALCAGQSAILTANIPTGAGPFTYLWSPGGETTSTISVNPASTTTYSVDVTGSCGGPVSSAPLTITVSPYPELNVTPGYSVICFGSPTIATLTATGTGSSYTWSPAIGLDATTGTTVNASGLSNSQVYTVSTSLGNCTTTKTALVRVPGPLYTFASANPPAVCISSSTGLNAAVKNTASYFVNSETASPVSTPAIGVTTLDKTSPLFFGNYNNGCFEVNLPFRASFFDEGYEKIYINTNGYIGAPGSVKTPTVIPSATSPNPAIFLAWKDWTIGSTGAIKYFTTGVAPNRVFVVKYENVPPVVGTGVLNGQIELYESGDIVLFLQSTDAASTKALGIEGANGIQFNSVSSRNGDASPWAVTSPEQWKFTPQGGSFTYSWTPVGDVFDPTAAFTLTNQLFNLPITFNLVVQDTSGCSNTSDVTVIEGTGMAINIVPSPNDTACLGTTINLTANVIGGGQPFTFTWDDGNSIIPGNLQTIQVTPGLGASTYNVTVTDQCSDPAEGTINLFINPNPSVAIAASPIATSGGALNCGSDSATLVASGSSVSYAWSPSAGLGATTGSTVKVLASSSTTYTATGTNAFGCTAKATVPVVKSFSVNTTVAATPPLVCTGGSTQLNANGSLIGASAYTVASIPYASINPVNAASLSFSSFDDGQNTVTLPFGFSFFGNTYNSANVSTNGALSFTDAITTTLSQTLPSTGTPNNVIALSWADLNVISPATIDTFTVGTSPNRIFVISYNNVRFFSGSAGNVTGQIQLFEGSSAIEIHVFKVDHGTSTAPNVLGIENATGTVGFMAPGRQREPAWNVSVPEAWKFSLPSTGIFSWTPSTFLSSTTIPNPVASGVTSTQTYTVTSTSNDGCKGTTTVSVSVTPFVFDSLIAKSSSICQDSAVTINAYVHGGGTPYTYAWLDNGNPVGVNSSVLNFIPVGAGLHTISVTVTDNCGSPAGAGSTNITIKPKPTVTATTSGEICGTAPSTLTASGADTYTWSPALSVQPSTGSIVTATPTSSVIYTVTGTATLTGCRSTGTVTQIVHRLPTVSPTATPNPILLNANTQLAANASQTFASLYAITPIPYVPVVPSGTPTVLQTGGVAVTPLTSGSMDDGVWSNINLPSGFVFNFFGQPKTGIAVSTNGFITFTASNVDAGCCSGQLLPNATTPNDVIAMGWEDWTHTTGTMDYFTNGTAPNRKFVIRAQGIPRFSGTGAPSTVMIVLNETVNSIEIHIGSIVCGTGDATTLGIENSTGTVGQAIAGRNSLTGWTATNEGWLLVPDAPPAVFTYAWTPPDYLDNTTIPNPFATSVGAVTNYTVVVTNLTNGCVSLPGNIMVLAGVDLSVGVTVSAADATLCLGESATINSNVSGGGVPYQYSWSNGTSVVGTNPNLTVTPNQTTVYTLTVTDVGNNQLSSEPVEIVVNPLPIVSITPLSGSICNGSAGIELTANGATTYTWAPTTGLTPSTGALVVANPAATTTYSATGTITATGCRSVSNTATIHRSQQTTVARGLPYDVCFGQDGELETIVTSAIVNYDVAPAAYGLLFSPTFKTLVFSSQDDGDVLDTIPFNFDYYGFSRNRLRVGTNGFISFTDGATTLTSQTLPSTTAPNNVIALSWNDMLISTGNVTTFTVGAAPDRIFVISYNNIFFYNGGVPAGSFAGQIHLFERNSTIETHLTIADHGPTTHLNAMGIENAAGTLGVAPPNRNRGVAWNALVPEAWRFTPQQPYAFSWSPADNLSNKLISDPVIDSITTTTTYTISVTEAVSGCTSTDTAKITVLPLPTATVSGSTILCPGTSTNITFNFTGVAPFAYSYTDGISTFGPFTSATSTAVVSVTPPGIAGEVITYRAVSISDTRCSGTQASMLGSAVITLVPYSSLTGVSLTSNKPLNNICAGDRIVLSLNGISSTTLGYQAQWKWYRGSCTGTLIATGPSSITVNPTTTTTYFVKAEGYCNTTACLSITVIVSTSSTNGNISFSYTPQIAFAGATDSVVAVPIAGATYYRWNTSGNTNILFDGNPAPYLSTSSKVMVTFIGPSTSGSGIGNYHISVFAANGCGRSNHTNLQIRSTVSAPSPIVGENVACVGQAKTYSIDPISGAKSYAWAFTSGSGTITGNGTTTVSVTFTSLPATLCVHGVTSFNSPGPDQCINVSTVISVPGPISGSITPCQGSSSVYFITPVPGASTYDWSTTIPGANIVETGTSATVTFPNGAFSGTICVQANSGCVVSGNTCLAVVNGAPAPVGTISGPVIGLCNVTSVNYQIPSTGDTLYTWSVPSGATIGFGQGTNSILVNFSDSFAGGNISVIASNACGSVSGSLPVSGNPVAPFNTPSASSACAEDLVSYSASSVGATSYQWNIDTGVIAFNSPNFDNITVQWGTNGGLVTAIAVNGCGVSAPTTIITAADGSCAPRLSNGLSLSDKLQAYVFPNPSHGAVSIQYNSPENAEYMIKVTDLTGRLILRETIQGLEGINQHDLDLSNLAKGMYKLSIENATGESVVMKVVIE